MNGKFIRSMHAGAVIGAMIASVGSIAAAAEEASASLKDRDGKPVGEVRFVETPNGTLLHATLRGLPEGTHAFHVHEVGKCEPPFESAGGHANPEDTAHGLKSGSGPHAGDMPNIHVPSSGELEVEVYNERLQFDNALFDSDGAAVVIHAGADDYETDPAGAAGNRIACGVIER
ncbi:MAG: superoxide dismutase family protein [Alphaproteobacteria bacterium]